MYAQWQGLVPLHRVPQREPGLPPQRELPSTKTALGKGLRQGAPNAAHSALLHRTATPTSAACAASTANRAAQHAILPMEDAIIRTDEHIIHGQARIIATDVRIIRMEEQHIHPDKRIIHR